MKNSIARDSVYLSFSKILTQIISLVTVMVLSRYRTLAEYGTYSQLLIIINLTSVFMQLGLPHSINFFLSKAETIEEKRQFLSVFYTLDTLLGLMTGLILLLLLPLLESFFSNTSLSSYWFFFAIIPWCYSINSSLGNVLIVTHNLPTLYKYQISHSCFLLVAVLSAWVMNLSFVFYLQIVVLGEFFFTVISYFIIYKIHGKLSIKLDFGFVKAIFTYSIPIGLASLVGTLSLQLDKLIVSYFFSIEELAIYAIAARELPLTIITSSITAILIPQIVKWIHSEKCEIAFETWREIVKLSYILISIVVFGIFTFAPDVISLLYSAKYITGVSVFRIYSLVLLFRFTYFGMFLNASGHTKIILYSSIFSLAINVILDILLIPLFGIIGPAIATFVTILGNNLYLLFMTSKIFQIKFSAIFPWKSLFKYTVINIGFSLIFFQIKNISTLDLYISSEWESVMLGIIWSSIYLLVFLKPIKRLWSLIDN